MASEESHNKPSSQGHHSKSGLFSSAKVVADAAQSTFRNESDKVDRAKAAHAAGDLLDAAGQYGNLDDQKGIGQYLDKAADYLHQYQNTNVASKPAESRENDAKSGQNVPKGFGGFFK